MSIPHAPWAHCYDFVYENSFGPHYQALTDLTVATIRELREPPCSVVDFGAGTGRLAIPLAACGYDVTAVEPCSEMMDVLLSKAKTANTQIQSRVERMQDFNGQGQFDIALCVFTTVIYLLDEASLRQGLTNLAASLKKKGRLLIDIPIRAAFQSYQKKTPVLERNVTVAPVDDYVYTYKEEIRCLMDGAWQKCGDTFSIRYWPADVILTILRELGVTYEGPVRGFQRTGSDYYRGTKDR